MSAWYNEIDPFAAEWLRNLIAAGHIAPGDVDERSITDVGADDLAGYDQCHFFAGIGGWSLALCLAGWPDDRPVWTGSCPCQPLSGAGRRKGHADQRHLWPAFHRLISKCAPAVVFGEQVAGKDGREWLAAVRADLEGDGYACGAADLCAAGIGAPHIRQRLWWVAERLADAMPAGRPEGWAVAGNGPSSGGGSNGGVANSHNAGLEGRVGAAERAAELAARQGGVAGWMADADQAGQRLERSAGLWRSELHDADGRGQDGRLGHAERIGTGRDAGDDAGSPSATGRPSPTNGIWRDADWLHCRDGKWRPVEPGTFPLAHGLSGRVGRLRAYGNAIVPQVAAQFIAAWREVAP